jgi:hypothetical protein
LITDILTHATLAGHDDGMINLDAVVNTPALGIQTVAITSLSSYLQQ